MDLLIAAVDQVTCPEQPLSSEQPAPQAPALRRVYITRKAAAMVPVLDLGADSEEEEEEEDPCTPVPPPAPRQLFFWRPLLPGQTTRRKVHVQPWNWVKWNRETKRGVDIRLAGDYPDEDVLDAVQYAIETERQLSGEEVRTVLAFAAKAGAKRSRAQLENPVPV